jgi:hypothetical protein
LGKLFGPPVSMAEPKVLRSNELQNVVDYQIAVGETMALNWINTCNTHLDAMPILARWLSSVKAQTFEVFSHCVRKSEYYQSKIPCRFCNSKATNEVELILKRTA